MTEFKSLSTEDIAYFFCILEPDQIRQSEEHLKEASKDHTEDLVYMPDIVLAPSTTTQVSQILKYCHEHYIPVTPRGAGTGLSGGALPVCGAVVLDMRYFNKILKIDTDNFQVITEPGVITEVLQNSVREYGLCYPPDPASKGSCFIGGNIAENSGGPRAVKYGVVKDYVLNLEIVLPNGEILWTGANTLKNATGYNLTQLIVGSEGTLAVVTKIVLRLIPASTENCLILIPFRKIGEACLAVNTIMKAGITPSALEFMERDALLWAMNYLPGTSIEVPDDIEAHLLVELDGHKQELLQEEAATITQLMEQYDIDDVLFADTEAQKSRLWQLRRVVGEAVKSQSVYKEEDTVVPRAYLPQLLAHVKALGQKYGFKSVCYGHAGDGNLHVNIIKAGMSNEDWENKLPIAIEQLFAYVVRVGGTLSGEHGIGFVQKRYLPIAFTDTSIALMKSIKQVFDPHGILNPGKIF